jgi:colanic acid biosynthesis protein WcaH
MLDRSSGIHRHDLLRLATSLLHHGFMGLAGNEMLGAICHDLLSIGNVLPNFTENALASDCVNQGLFEATMLLPPDKFLQIVEATPLVSVDLIIRNPAGEILLGKRNNPPAQDFWFVPGGRIRKNEQISEALQRVCRAELHADLAKATLLGVYDHLYEDNFLNQPGIGTHYVVLGFECALQQGQTVRPDPQHSEVRWWPIPALLENSAVHENTRRYFTSSANTFSFSY